MIKFSVGFSIADISEEVLDLVYVGRGREEAESAYVQEMEALKRDMERYMHKRIKFVGRSEEDVLDAEFSEWFTEDDMKRLIAFIQKHDITLGDGVIRLNDYPFVVKDFHAVEGHWGREPPVYYEDWDDEWPQLFEQY